MRIWVKLALGLFLWFSLTGETAARTLDGSPEIRFAPLDPILRPEVGYGGSTEFMNPHTPSAVATLKALAAKHWDWWPIESRKMAAL